MLLKYTQIVLVQNKNNYKSVKQCECRADVVKLTL